jgi:hypothetical protein
MKYERLAANSSEGYLSKFPSTSRLIDVVVAMNPLKVKEYRKLAS